MKTFRFLTAYFLLITLFFFTPSKGAAQDIGQQIHITWKSANDYGVNQEYPLHLILKNKSPQVVDLKGWDLWFNSIFPILKQSHPDYQLTDENGNLFKVHFLNNTAIASGDSLVIDFQSKYKIANVSSIVNGVYFQSASQPTSFFPVAHFDYQPLRPTKEEEKQFLSDLYDKNAGFQQKKSLPLFPSPKKIKENKGHFVINGNVLFHIDAAFHSESEKIQLALELDDRIKYTRSEDSGADLHILKNDKINHEGYKLTVAANGITIEAATSTGAFYAIQSIRSLMKAAELKTNPSAYTLPLVNIEDEPRFPYRGLMIDIARNFKDKSTLLKYIDIMSQYKLNKLHLHFIDDEGWRIEIPSLPELTEVGANRSPLFADGNSIQPAYGSGANASVGDFLSKTDFVELLRYAHDRHIQVIPEIETPGHARASIKAMATRYERYMAKGQPKEAEKYLLHDFEDKSVYRSAQYWNDNVMNVALPSTYTFIATVIDELKAMYVDAGLKMELVSIGGDEVPNGVWEQSPKIRELMEKMNFKSVHEVWPYYVDKVYLLAKSKDVEIAGWEEIGMVNKGEGMVVNNNLSYTTMQVDVWNNVIGFGQEDLAYRLANAGYKTVFISASNFYFDMAWNNQFAEPGLIWASLIDLYQSYSFLPHSFFGNIDLYAKGKAFDKSHFNKSVRLTEKGKSNLIGIKGGLWNETILDADRLDYMAFPRFFALAERAWSPIRYWESEQHFSKKKIDAEYGQFINRIGQEELPRLDLQGVNYRLPAVGVKRIQNKLHANLEYPGFDIFYTKDGTIPHRSTSALYTGPIDLDPSLTYTFQVIHEDGRTGIPYYYRP